MQLDQILGLDRSAKLNGALEHSFVLLDEEQRKKRRKFCRGGIFLLGQRRKRRKMIRKGKYIFAIKKKNREGTGGKHFLPLALLDLKPEFLLEHERIDKAPVVIQWS